MKEQGQVNPLIKAFISRSRSGKLLRPNAARAIDSRIKHLIAKRKPKSSVQLEFQFGGRK